MNVIILEDNKFFRKSFPSLPIEYCSELIVIHIKRLSVLDFGKFR